MTTTIRSNGSKWAGEAPDTIETLLDVLEGRAHRFAPNAERRFALDPTFEEYGNFVYTDCGLDGCTLTHFFGNFHELSHVFNIDTDDAALIERLTVAIRANQAWPEYAAAKVANAEREAARVRRDEQHAEERRRRDVADAKRVLGIS